MRCMNQVLVPLCCLDRIQNNSSQIKWGLWSNIAGCILYRCIINKGRSSLMRAALPLWAQKTELDLCHVWEHPTCLVSPHADHLFSEPAVAVEVQRLEERMHLVHVNCDKFWQTVMWAGHPSKLKQAETELTVVYLRGPSSLTWHESALQRCMQPLGRTSGQHR